METLTIYGRKPLHGIAYAHGSKNSALPILAATLLLPDFSCIHNCPKLSDVAAAREILEALGCKTTAKNHTVTVDATTVTACEIPDALMLKMRSSVMFLGAILGRMGEARLSAPGGCEIGLRPIDLHISAMRQMGANVQMEHGKLRFTTPKGLHGAQITLAFPSVGATENILLAAATAKGRTILQGAAREPEIVDLATFLNAAGAKIHGAGDSTIYIDGVKALHGTEHDVIPDRIEAASYLLAGAITGGAVCVQNMCPTHIGALFPIFEEMGCLVKFGKTQVDVKAPERLKPVKMTRTMPYPGFPTDAQALLSAALTVANGTSVLIENIFESRYKHAPFLARFGAKISVEGRMEVIEGVPKLHGAVVNAPDLRGGMALVLAGLAAEGETVVHGLSHIDRGYEAPQEAFTNLGATIKRTKHDAKKDDNRKETDKTANDATTDGKTATEKANRNAKQTIGTAPTNV